MAISSLIGGVLVHLTLGTIYTYSNMAPYIISYIRSNAHPVRLRGVDAPWVFASAAVGQSLSMYFGGLLAYKLSVRLATASGCLTLVCGILLSYLTIKVSYWVFLVTYGIMYGIGAGLAYVGPLYCVIRWFPNHKGLVNGLVVAGYGSGALIFSFVQSAYINPDNLSPSEDCPEHGNEKYFDNESLLRKVPYSFLLLGGVYFLIQLVGCMMIFEPRKSSNYSNSFSCCDGTVDPEMDAMISPDSPTAVDIAVSSSCSGYSSVPIDASYKSQKSNASFLDSIAGQNNQALLPNNGTHFPMTKSPQYLLVNGSYEQKKAREETLHSESMHPDNLHLLKPIPDQTEPVSLRPVEVLKDVNFYLLWFMFLLNTEAVVYVSSVSKIFGETFISGDRFLTAVTSASSGFNAAGRILWGLVSDRVSFKFAMVIMTALATVFLSTFYLSSLSDSRSMYLIWLCMIYLCLGGNYSLFPTATCQLFGPQHMAANYGLLFTSHAVSAVTGAVLSSSFSKSVGWFGSFITVAGFSCLGFLLSLIIRERKILRFSHL